MKLSKQQHVQENAYKFPYHYIACLDHGRFSQTRNIAGGFVYISNLSFLLAKIDELEFDSLLDVGCGDGRLLNELYKRYPKKQLVGLDISQRAINFARAFNPNIKFVVGDISKKEILNEKYDIVTLIEVLEHIPPKKISNFLDAVTSHLKKSGILILTVPSKNLKLRSKHYQHFDLDLLKDVLHNHFDIIEYCYLNKLSSKTKLIQDLLTNRFFILNHSGLIQLIYRYYRKNFLIGNKSDSRRIYAKVRKK